MSSSGDGSRAAAMSKHDPLGWIDGELARLDEQHLRRRLVTREGAQGARLVIAGREYVNFASNDYLGLAGDARLVEVAARAADQEGWGAGASPLIVGHAVSHRRLEERLADFEGTEAALVFSSGYAANVGTICALAGEGDAIFSDELNHASIVDGCRLSRAAVHVYPHGDGDALQEQLRRAGQFRRRLIVSDSLFSMHGDVAPLNELAELAERHDAMLMVDEAHATGVFGPRGAGAVEHLGLEGRVHVRVGTLSKALGCQGGFVSGDRRLIDWLVNKARPYIFSTASIPANSAAAMAALDIVSGEPYRRQKLLAAAEDLRRRLRERGWNTGASASQIVPVFVGESQAALRLAAALRERGLWAPAIRPPSVPVGQACLRISLSYGHTPEMVERLIEALEGER
jgi:8-amino-7-oxononanoate synthase